MKPVVIGVVLAALTAAVPAGAASRAARPLDIRSDGTHVLACIPVDENDVVDVANAGVSPVKGGSKNPATPWQIALEAGNTPVRLGPGDCLTLHRRLPGYVDTAEPTEILAGWPYTFTIRSAEWGKHGTRLHGGTFCFARAKDRLRVVQVPKTHATVDAEACARLLAADASSPDSDAEQK